MDSKQHKELVKASAKQAFGRRKRIASSYVPLYPQNAERELRTLARAYTRILKKEITNHLPEIMEAYKKTRRNDSREDGFFDLTQEIARVFQDIGQAFEKKIARFGLRKKVAKVATGTRNTAYREWKLCVKKTVGLDLIDNYYNKDFYSSIMEPWIDNSVSMIQSIPQEELGKMRDIISDGFRNDKSIAEITAQIRQEYKVSYGKAQFLARDQIGTLNAELTRRQHEDAGVSKYKWVSVGDSRVRDCHRFLNGHTFRWDSPPAMWVRQKGGAVVLTGRHCHPGQDYGCRCHAAPVFEIDTLDIPVK